MVATTRSGNAAWYIAICTSIPIVAPNAHQPSPDGDVAYFYVTQLNARWMNGNKVTRYSARVSSSDKRGVSANFVNIKEGWLLNTDINGLVEYIINGGHTFGHTLLYCLVKLDSPGGSQATSTHLAFKDENETTVWYLKGHVKVADIDLMGNKLYKVRLRFEEVTHGV